MKLNDKAFINIKAMDTVEDNDGVITIEGYANRFIDDAGELIIDRSQEAVLPAGMKLSDYNKNPVLLKQHNPHQLIGKVVSIEPRVEGIYIKAEVHEALDAQAAYAVRKGLLKGLSLGFRVKDYKVIDDGYLLTETELFEVSLVTIPDNQDSLVTLTKGACSGEACGIATKALPKDTPVEELLWKALDKQELKQSVNDIDELCLVDDKFPHHIINAKKELEFNHYGFNSAVNALRGAIKDEALEAEKVLKALEHIKKHLGDIKIEKVSENARNLIADYFDIYKELSEATADESEEESTDTSDESTQDENPDEGSQNEEPTDDTGSEGTKDGDKPDSIDEESVLEWVRSNTETVEGLNTVLNFYYTVEEIINSTIKE